MRLITPCIRYASRSHPTCLNSLRTPIRLVTTKPPVYKPPVNPKIKPQGRANEQPSQTEVLRGINSVDDLYSQGHRILYTAPRRLTYFRLQCWTVIGMGLSFMTFYFENKLYDAAEQKRLGVEHPWLTTIAETATAVVIAAVCGTCVYRLMNHVQIVQLVKEMDIVFIRISSRSVIPFVKSHVAVRPYNLALSDRLKMPPSPPKWVGLKKLNESSVSALIVSVLGNTVRAFPLLLWHIFSEARRFVTSEGDLKAKIIGEDAKTREASQGYYILDVDGDWVVRGAESSSAKKPILYEIGRTQRF